MKRQQKAASLSWKRSNLLAKAADVAPGQARNALSTYRNTDRAQIIYDWLDAPVCNWNSPIGQELLKGAKNATNGMGKRRQEFPKRKGMRKGQTQRVSKGDPTRPPRAGAPNLVINGPALFDQSDLISVTLLRALINLESEYGVDQVRQGTQFLDVARQV